jgi:16S rRNA (adenine1518-N6/adenine1519-N6)-dimethyltransferase
MNYDSPSDIKRLLKKSNLALKKRWGQNFLVNPGVRKKIIDLTEPGKDECIWEIGPGLGSITEPLLEAGSRVIAFEIDWGMVRYLEQVFSHHQDLTIVQGDVVKTWQSVYTDYGKPEKIMGNLPYASASAIIISFVTHGCIPGSFVFTVQRELAERMSAPPGTKHYSSFSIYFQFSFSIIEKQDIRPGSFYPAPDVVSSVIKAVPADQGEYTCDRNLFFQIVRAGFTSRRKTLFNNLVSDKELKNREPSEIQAAIEKTGFSKNSRAEEFTVKDFIHLACLLQSRPGK